jgi:hypothetical protein
MTAAGFTIEADDLHGEDAYERDATFEVAVWVDEAAWKTIPNDQRDDTGRALAGTLGRLFTTLYRIRHDLSHFARIQRPYQELDRAHLEVSSLVGPNWVDMWLSVTFHRDHNVSKRDGIRIVRELLAEVLADGRKPDEQKARSSAA